MVRSLPVLIAAAVLLAVQSANRSSELVDQIASDYVHVVMSAEVFPDRSPAAIAEREHEEDRIAQRLRAIREDQIKSPDAKVTYAVLEEDLASRAALRVCRRELWDLSQTQGWQTDIGRIAESEPVATDKERRDALREWKAFPAFVDTNIANLRVGLQNGYSVPRSVVGRVEQQIAALLSERSAQTALDSPARRAADPEFASEYRSQMALDLSAIQRYQTFLKNEYEPRARSTLGVSELPNGPACYSALLRRYATMPLSADAVFELGTKTVSESTAEVRRLGATLFGNSNLTTIIHSTEAAPGNRFRSKDGLLQFSRDLLERARRESSSLFPPLPRQAVVIRPVPAYLEHSGISSHYESSDGGTAVFWIALDAWQTETRGAAEITVVHETFPGHHVQAVIGRQAANQAPLAGVIAAGAYVEGWANYAEQLAEETHIDDDDYERIQRRAIFGRSLVLDVGLHVRGWTREQAISYAMEAGMTHPAADDLVDRVAVEPAQLTTYELGGLTIRRLRDEARRRLGARFDVRAFHQRVLEHGPVPLSVLEQLVERGEPGGGG